MSFAIDHVHIEVKDRLAAAAFFERALGFEVDEALAFWADDEMGPLIIKSPHGDARLSLFQRPDKQHLRDNTIALRLNGESFLAAIDRLAQNNVKTPKGLLVGRDRIVNHDVSWSLYFCDLDGNRFELTTYDYHAVRKML